MKKIKKFFKTIFNWVKENPAVQPLIIILLIFVVIFGLTKVGTVYNTVKGWFPSSVKKPVEVDYEGVNELFDKDGDYILVYGAESCSACQHFLEKPMSRYLKSKSPVKAYYFDYDNAVDEDKISTIDLILQREKLYNLSNDKLNYTNSWDYSELNTPTLFLFESGVTTRIHAGSLEYGQLKDFVNKTQPFKI